MASFGFCATLITFATILSTTTAERVYCDGSCTCWDSTDDSCILNCARTDSCKQSRLICPPDRSCIVECVASASCSDGAIIDGARATDVLVICDGVDACKTGLSITCGSGDCELQCGDGTSCENFGSVNINQADSFKCTNCPQDIDSLQFTKHPTTNPTEKPSIDPTKNPSLHPTVPPTKNPTYVPTKNPIMKPTAPPTDAPTLSPTRAPTLKPTVHSTDEPTFAPTSRPTNYPIDILTLNPIKQYTTTTTTTITTSDDSNPTETIFPTKSPVMKYMSTNTDEIVFDTEFVDPVTMLAVSRGINIWNDYSELIVSIALVLLCGVMIVICHIASSRRKRRNSVEEKKIEEHNLMQVFHGDGDIAVPTNVTLTSEGDDGGCIKYSIVVHHEKYEFEYKLKSVEEQSTNGPIWDEDTYEMLQNAICMKFGLESESFALYELVDGDVIDIDDVDDIMAAFDTLLDGFNPRELHIFVDTNAKEGRDIFKADISPVYQGTAGGKASMDLNFSYNSQDITTLR